MLPRASSCRQKRCNFPGNPFNFVLFPYQLLILHVHTRHSAHKQTHNSACQVLISTHRDTSPILITFEFLYRHLFDSLWLKHTLKSKWKPQPYTSQNNTTTHSCPCIFCVLFNGSSVSSVLLNVLVENYLSPGSAADLISIHTVSF